ncbi:YeeE/YedE family protein [Stella sp.]|uniref:YeeE/YedE family protein n=1 Tax=Stella sp. TaxID=2912054 RepID=UPI0035AE16C2
MTPETSLTPWTGLAGGGLIGLAAALLMLFEGRVAGISGLAARLLGPAATGTRLRAAAFLAGLVAAPLLVLAAGHPVPQTVPDDAVLLAVAGLLVGFGTVLGGGCTSGHGVCGIARLSPRSLAATAIFMATALATVFAVRHLGIG